MAHPITDDIQAPVYEQSRPGLAAFALRSQVSRFYLWIEQSRTADAGLRRCCLLLSLAVNHWLRYTGHGCAAWGTGELGWCPGAPAVAAPWVRRSDPDGDLWFLHSFSTSTAAALRDIFSLRPSACEPSFWRCYSAKSQGRALCRGYGANSGLLL